LQTDVAISEEKAPYAPQARQVTALSASWERLRMAKGQQRGNREQKKPKKEKVKVIAAAPPTVKIGQQPLKKK
jgi:hypothetical protein